MASSAKRTAEGLDADNSQEGTAKRVKSERISSSHLEIREGQDHIIQAEDNLDDDSKNMAAYIHGRQSTSTLGTPPNAGFMKKIAIRNFMNHSNTIVEFGPKLNFIVGHNGSGKSAILTAVAIALGAKASITGRGHSVKDLIKRGEDRAELILTMANEEPNAFEHETYGDTIVIKRIIDKSGSSRYEFRGTEDGKVLAKKRTVIAQICSHYDIDIDSPLTILTQDAAKSFLAQSEPHQLYKFFLQGTKLSDLSDSYQKIKDAAIKIESQLAQAKEDLPELQDKVDRLQREVIASEKAKGVQEELAQTKMNLGWAFVASHEVTKAAQVQTLRDAQQKVHDTRAALEETEGNRAPLQQKIDELKRELDDVAMQRKPVLAEMATAKAAMKSCQSELSSINGSIDEVMSEITSSENELQQFQSKIDDRGATQDPKQESIREEIAQLDKMLSNMRRSLPNTERDVKINADELERAEQAIEEAERKRDSIQRDLHAARDRHSQIVRSQKNRLEAFGKNIDLVMNEIKRARWHRSPPIGPIGQYVKLKDMSYSTAVQSWMGGTLCSFIVLDSHDYSTLQQIFHRCQQRGFQVAGRHGGVPFIVRFSGDMFDFSQGDLSGRNLGDATAVETVLSKLEVNNDIALRVLINAHHVEKVLVARDVRAADDLVHKVFADPHAGQVTVLSGGSQPFTSTAKSRTSRSSGPVNIWNGAPLFVENLAEEVGNVEQQIKELERSHRDAVNDVSGHVETRKALTKKKGELNQSLAKVNNGILRFSARLRDKNDELESILPPTEDDVAAYVKEREDTLRGVKAQLVELEGLREAKQADHDEATMKLQNLKDSDRNYVVDQEKRKEVYSNLEVKLAELVNAIGHYQKRIDVHSDHVDKATEKLQGIQKHLDNFVAGAEEMCNDYGASPERRQVDPEKITELKNRVDALNTQIAEAKKRNPVDQEKLSVEYEAAVTHLNDQQNSINTFDKVSKTLKTTIETRMIRWDILRHHLAVRARTGFIIFLNNRNMDGHLGFNHESETLSINVVATGLGENTQNPHVKAPQELSGGERSYVTVCLLLSLWDLAPSTIRCLDEWDVFLDMVNRQLAAALLIEHAEKSSNKQFVLITPQDMAGVDRRKSNMKIIRLKDPVRNQTTLPFQPV